MCALYAIACNALYVIAKHRFAVLWQSPGRVTFLIIWCFLLYCQKDTLAVYWLDKIKTNTCKILNQLNAEYAYFE